MFSRGKTYQLSSRVMFASGYIFLKADGTLPENDGSTRKQRNKRNYKMPWEQSIGHLRTEEGDCSLDLESCQAPAFEKVSVSAKATDHLTSSPIMDHPICHVYCVVSDREIQEIWIMWVPRIKDKSSSEEHWRYKPENIRDEIIYAWRFPMRAQARNAGPPK